MRTDGRSQVPLLHEAVKVRGWMGLMGGAFKEKEGSGRKKMEIQHSQDDIFKLKCRWFVFFWADFQRGLK